MKGKTRGYTYDQNRQWEQYWAWYPRAVYINYHNDDNDRRWRWVWREWIWIKADRFGDYVYQSIEQPIEAIAKAKITKKQKKRMDRVDAAYLEELHKVKAELDGNSNEPI